VEISKLSLDAKKSPRNKNVGTEKEVVQRKALRLFYMVWSGMTRLIRAMVVQNGKPFEIQGLGTFGPLVDKFRKYRDPLDKGEEKVNEGPSLRPIRFLAHDDFVN